MQEKGLIKVLIVDDEPAGRRILQTYLEKYCSGVLVVGLASNGLEAAELVAEKNPDLVFLDIEMPVEDGITFLARYAPIPFEVIFTTAFEKYALKAFEVSAIHYLLKPIKLEELLDALEKYKNTRGKAENQVNLKQFLQKLKRQEQNKGGRIAIHTSDAIEILEVNQIIRCQAESNYSTIYMSSGKTWIVSKTLKEFVQKLEPFGFVRTHRSHLINMDYILKFRKTKSHQIELKDGTVLTLSAGRRDEFMKKFADKFGLDD